MPPYDRWIPTCVGMTYAHRQATESKPLDSRASARMTEREFTMAGKPSSSPIPFFLPLPLRERAGVRGLCSRMFQLPLPAQANRDAVRGFLPGLFCPFTLKGHVQQPTQRHTAPQPTAGRPGPRQRQAAIRSQPPPVR